MAVSANDVVEQVRARLRTAAPLEVRHLAEDIIAEHAAALDVIEVLDLVTGLGPLQPLMDDPTVEEIWINEPTRVFAARNGHSELTGVVLSENLVHALVERMLAATGRRVDLASPFVDATLPDGSRLHVAIPDVTREHWAVNIRKFVIAAQSLENLVAVGALTAAAANYLRDRVLAGASIIVSGGTQAGKTTLMNALLNSAAGADRIITCEEVFELQLTSPDWVALQTRQPSLEGAGEIPLRRLIREALRMRPSRLVVGEVRHEECLDLLIAMNAGMPSMCSIHADGAREALAKLVLLPMLAGSNISADFVVPAVAAAVDVVVHVARGVGGVRQVTQIGEVTGRVESHTIEMNDVFAIVDGQLTSVGATALSGRRR
jgi:pilus assembly protein CpaF